jgi:putative PIN family toxin of toxin-antitoxin system
MRYTGDPTQIEFVARRTIVLQLGTPLTQIQPYRYGSLRLGVARAPGRRHHGTWRRHNGPMLPPAASPPITSAVVCQAVPRIVIDTNVLLDLWVFEDPRAGALHRALAQGAVQALRSQDTDDELRDVLGRAQFALPEHRQAALLEAWQALALVVPRVFAAPWHCTDPEDQKFLDLAHTARAAALLTKDKALLKVNRRARRDGLLITPPSDWAVLEPRVQDRVA